MNEHGPSNPTSEPDLDRFHQELRAAVLSRVPLELGNSKSSSLPGGRADANKLARLEEAVQNHLAGGQSLAGVPGDHNELPDRYRAALQVFYRTGEMPLVLEALATEVRSRRQLARLLRSTVVYLLIVLGIALLGLWFFAGMVMPSLDNMRDDMQLLPGSESVHRGDGMMLIQCLLVILPLGLLLVLTVLAFMGGPGTIAAWLGGRRYQTHRATATAIQTIRALVAGGMPISEAVSMSCVLVGGSPAVERQVSMSVRDEPTGSASFDHLQSLANHFQSSAANRLAVLRVVLPIALVAVVGGSAGMAYGLSVFLPVMAMLKDLAMPWG